MLLDSKNISKLSESTILKTPLKKLSLKATDLIYKDCISDLYIELDHKGIHYFRPKIYISDEWFCPEDSSLIAIPFYLCHPRLLSLEKKYFYEAEGSSRQSFVKLLRHECGHAIDHAFRLSYKKKWKELFGESRRKYSTHNYKPKIHSQNYVQHLDNWYAQAHPDEDFAETFAVWLDPKSNWAKKYEKWPKALNKLNYIDSIAKNLLNKKVALKTSNPLSPLKKIKKTYSNYLAKKKKELGDDYYFIYDKDLKSIFSLIKTTKSASSFIQQNKVFLRNTLHLYLGEKKYSIDLILKKIIQDCKRLKLYTPQKKSDDRLLSQLSIYLSTLVSHYFFTGEFKRKL